MEKIFLSIIYTIASLIDIIAIISLIALMLYYHSFNYLYLGFIIIACYALYGSVSAFVSNLFN